MYVLGLKFEQMVCLVNMYRRGGGRPQHTFCEKGEGVWPLMTSGCIFHHNGSLEPRLPFQLFVIYWEDWEQGYNKGILQIVGQ